MSTNSSSQSTAVPGTVSSTSISPLSHLVSSTLIPKEFQCPQRIEQKIEKHITSLVTLTTKVVTCLSNKTEFISVMRGEIKSILTRGVTGDKILKLLTLQYYKLYNNNLPSSLKIQCQVAQLAAMCSVQMRQAENKQELIHIENFLLNCVLCFKTLTP